MFKNLLLLSLIFLSNLLNSQITINSAVNAEGLVSNLVGVGVSTSNPQLIAAPNAVGTFNAVNSNIGLSSGVILTTGLAPTTPGFFGANQGCPVVPGLSNPQTSGAFASTSHNLFPVNVPELQTLFPQNQQFYDRAILTFQFVPQSTPVSFRYVFASEEWPDWINTAFNDVFGFFISGPGIVGEQNIAVLPGTNTPITATTMNSSVIVNNQFPATCAYNGYTPVFAATANVIPCSTYTIKLIIADVGDSSFDSAVFLEENSFGTAPFNVETSSLAGDNITYEGCAPATVTFSRLNATNQPLTINYTVGGTATMGVDYLNIPTTVTIPAGQTSTSIQIVGIEDNFPELTETITITYSTGCGTFETITIFLMDKPPVTVEVDDAPSICDGSGPVTLIVSGGGGLPPLTYSWSGGAGNTANVEVNPNTTTTYTVSVTDFCESTATADVIVTILPKPVVSFTVPEGQCFNDNSFSFIALGEFSNTATYIWDFGASANPQTSNIINPSGVSFTNVGTQTITIQVNENGCLSEPFTENVTIHDMPVANFISDVQEGCALMKVNFINLSESQSGLMTYQWTFGDGSNSQSINPSHIYSSAGIYTVGLTVTTSNGCSDSYIIDDYIKSFPKATADFMASPWDIEIIKPEIELTSLSSNAVDGFYIIGESEVIYGLYGNYTFTEEGIYPITHVAINEFGCNDTIIKNVVVRKGFRIYFPNVFTPDNDNNNDTFKPYGEGYNYYELKIYNRWGELIYRSFDIENGWDGKIKISNQIAPSGIYFYCANVTENSGKEHIFYGWVMLLR